MATLNPNQKKKIESLKQSFLARETNTETDQDKMNAFVELAFNIRLIQAGLEIDDKRAEYVEMAVLQHFREFDPDDPALAEAAPIFRRLGKGCLEDATKFLHGVIAHRRNTLLAAHRAKQSAIAKAPRSPHVLDAIIEGIVKGIPDITCEVILERLQSMLGNGIISNIDPPGFTIEEDNRRQIDFEYQEKRNTKSLKISGLHQRLSRIKKSLRN